MDSAEEPNFETPLTSEIDESPLCQLNISHQQRERRRKSNEKKKRLEKYLLGYLEVLSDKIVELEQKDWDPEDEELPQLLVKMKRRFTKCLTDLNKVRGIKEPSTKSSVFIYTGTDYPSINEAVTKYVTGDVNLVKIGQARLPNYEALKELFDQANSHNNLSLSPDQIDLLVFKAAKDVTMMFRKKRVKELISSRNDLERTAYAWEHPTTVNNESDLPCTSNTIPQLSSEPPTLDSETEMIFEKNRLAAEEKIEKLMAEYEERVSKNEQEGIPDILTDIAESDSEKTGGGGGDDDDEDDDESTDPDESEESDETPELIADEIASEGSPPSVIEQSSSASGSTQLKRSNVIDVITLDDD